MWTSCGQVLARSTGIASAQWRLPCEAGGQAAGQGGVRFRRRKSLLHPAMARRIGLGSSSGVVPRPATWEAVNRGSPVMKGLSAGASSTGATGEGAADVDSDKSASLRRVALVAAAATDEEEKEATRLLREAEESLGLREPREGSRRRNRDGSWEDDSDGDAESSTWLQKLILANQKLLTDWRMSLAQVTSAQQLLEVIDERVRLEEEEEGEERAVARGTSSRSGSRGTASATTAAKVRRRQQQQQEQQQRRITVEDAAWLVECSLALGNAELARSILDACRMGKSAAQQQQLKSAGLKWPPADVVMYSAYITGLAALLRVTDAVTAVREVQRRGLPPADEVPFGNVVRCPTCVKRPLIVVQPQVGSQMAACSNCRYEYELISGELVSSDSETLLEGPSAVDRVLRFLRLKRTAAPTAVHSLVVKSPDGTSQIRTFATSTPSVPAQQGERLTLTCAAPADSAARRQRRVLLGLLPAAAARAPGWRPGEPMELTNHATAQVLPLLRAPPKSEQGLALPSWLLPASLVVAANATAGSVFIDPQLPALIAGAVVSSAAVGTAATTMVLPRLRQLPAGSVEGESVRQELLKQHATLQSRLDSLTQSAADEVRMLARMWQLQNKMEAVGEPSTYGARLERVVGARIGIEQRLQARLKLIDSYAKIAAMVEIEVEMDSDVAAAEAAGAAASIAEQIERLMEVESLQKEWRQQAEANDEVERILRSAPLLPDMA